MALTRPLLEQINTDLVALSDPLISVNRAGTPVDSGIIINVNGGTSPNVALIWSQSNSRMTLGETTSGATTTGNISLTNLTSLELGAIRMNGVDVTVDGTGKLTVGGSEVTVTISSTQVQATDTASISVGYGVTRLELTQPECLLTLIPDVEYNADVRSVKLHIKQGTGSNTITWPQSVKWPNNRSPNLSFTQGMIDVVELISVDNGVTWIGTYVGGWISD